MTATQTKLLTVADLEAMGGAAEHLELIRGVAHEMSPTGGQHGLITSLLNRRLGGFVEARDLGETFGAETGFIVARNPDSVLAPDIAFVARGRLTEDEDAPVGFLPFAPDLAIEVASPSNTEADLLLKTSLYLAGGAKQVWIVRPRHQTVTVFSPDEPERVLGVDDALDGGAVVPGFSLPVRQIFQRSAARREND